MVSKMFSILYDTVYISGESVREKIVSDHSWE